MVVTVVVVVCMSMVSMPAHGSVSMRLFLRAKSRSLP